MKLSIYNLQKTYANGVKALNGVSLEIESGMFGLLGPNGAGKSSLMRTLVGLQEADQGSASLGEIDVLNNKEALRENIGYLPQSFGLYPKVSAEMLLDHFAALKGVTDRKARMKLVNELLNKVNLEAHRKKHLGGFSGGMKQRFGIAQALIGNPALLVVDEPTAGLDPAERNRFHNVLSEVGEQTIVILSTHIVEDVKDLCTQMAILNKGQLCLKGAPAELVNQLNGQVWEKAFDKAEVAMQRQKHSVISERVFAGQTLIRVFSEHSPAEGFEAVTANLEDVYFSQIGLTTQNLAQP